IEHDPEKWTPVQSADFDAGAAGVVAPLGLLRSLSMTARTAEPALRVLTDSSSGAAAPDLRIRLCASGSMIGSSHGPWTTNGRSNSLAVSFDASVATPL